MFFSAGGHAVVPNEARNVCNVIPALKVFQQKFAAFDIWKWLYIYNYAFKNLKAKSKDKQYLNSVSLFLLPSTPYFSLCIPHAFLNNILIFYSSMFHLYFHGKLFCALSVPGHCTQLTLSFFNQDGGLVEEPTTSPFLPSPSLKLPLSNSALPNQTLGGIASGLGMQNLNSSRQVRYLFSDNCVKVGCCLSKRNMFFSLFQYPFFKCK